jgi:hypothetical protein
MTTGSTPLNTDTRKISECHFLSSRLQLGGGHFDLSPLAPYSCKQKMQYQLTIQRSLFRIWAAKLNRLFTSACGKKSTSEANQCNNFKMAAV